MSDKGHGNGIYMVDRRIWYGLLALCAVLLFADVLYHRHIKLAVEGWFGFYAFFGLIASVVLGLVARALQWLIMRPENYYGDDHD